MIHNVLWRECPIVWRWDWNYWRWGWWWGWVWGCLLHFWTRYAHRWCCCGVWQCFIVVVANNMYGSAMYELVWINSTKFALIYTGAYRSEEVIRRNYQTGWGFCYYPGLWDNMYQSNSRIGLRLWSTQAGLSVGELVARLHKPLSAELGPGMCACLISFLHLLRYHGERVWWNTEALTGVIDTFCFVPVLIMFRFWRQKACLSHKKQKHPHSTATKSGSFVPWSSRYLTCNISMLIV